MTWIKFPENKPESDLCALVSNERGFMFDVKAIYHHGYDIWTLDDPNQRVSVTLDVTHYLPIPHFKVKY